VLFRDSFFGISIMTFYIIMICILLALSFKYKGLHRTEKIFHCKYCGAPMCHTCRKGIICQTCHALLAKVSNQELSKSIATKIIASKHSRDRILGLCVEALIPGGGHLLWSDKTLPPRVILLPCSTIVVGTYYFFTRIVTSSPSFVIRPYMNMVLAVCILYNVLFCWIALKKIMNNRTTSKSR
ncbi:MAG: hypothetical protein JW795_19550, partial [Chitinivibrionales bacterium]|nr:hypothetical protein [Chitinivibrionales bacterium]